MAVGKLPEIPEEPEGPGEGGDGDGTGLPVSSGWAGEGDQRSISIPAI